MTDLQCQDSTTNTQPAAACALLLRLRDLCYSTAIKSRSIDPYQFARPFPKTQEPHVRGLPYAILGIGASPPKREVSIYPLRVVGTGSRLATACELFARERSFIDGVGFLVVRTTGWKGLGRVGSIFLRGIVEDNLRQSTTIEDRY